MSKICPRCSNENIKEDYKYCPICGLRLEDVVLMDNKQAVEQLKDLKENLMSNGDHKEDFEALDIAIKALETSITLEDLECIYRHLNMFVQKIWDKKENVLDACEECKHFCSNDKNILDPWKSFYKLSNLVFQSGREGEAK